jgi:hypothetical protein
MGLNLYARLSRRKAEQASEIVAELAGGSDWLTQMDAKFCPVWDEFAEWWSKNTGECPEKTSFYTTHNAHYLVEWAIVKHPELFE